MESIELNSEEYIDEAIRSLTNQEMVDEQTGKFLINISIGIKSLIYGRKWVLFLSISMLPLLLTLLVDDHLMENPDAPSAFTDFYIGFFFLLLFNFGCLMMALPLSADEISDHITDMYLVRPIKRETFWLSKWIVVNLAIFVLNATIALIYYTYFHLMDDSEDFLTGFGNNLDLLFYSLIFILAASLMYGGIFLFVGFIGNKGFTFGIILALFEQFFLSLLFLANNKWIPRTNMLKIADRLFGKYFEYEDAPKGLSYFESWLYLIIFTAVFLVIGAAYLRRREFK